MTKNMEEEKEAQMDFNVFVGAETGILKGINVNRKMNICKNFHNIKSLDKVTHATRSCGYYLNILIEIWKL